MEVSSRVYVPAALPATRDLGMHYNEGWVRFEPFWTLWREQNSHIPPTSFPDPSVESSRYVTKVIPFQYGKGDKIHLAEVPVEASWSREGELSIVDIQKFPSLKHYVIVCLGGLQKSCDINQKL